MTDADEQGLVRDRLRALRERHQSNAVEAELDLMDGAETNGMAASTSERRGRRQQGGTGGGREALTQRLAQFLAQPVPGGQVIPGTGLYEARVKQAMNFLQQRARAEGASGGSRGARFQKLLDTLTEARPGDRMAAGVNVTRLEQLLSASMQSAQGVGVAPSEQTVPGVLLEQVAGQSIQETLQQLVAVTARLSRDLEEAKAKINEIAAGRLPVVNVTAAEGPDEGLRGGNQPDAKVDPEKNWLDDFL
jgi:hypothetical protein